MKKILIFIIIIIMIVISIFVYKNYFKNNDIDNQIVLNSDGDFLLYIDEIHEDGESLKIQGTISKGSIKTNNEISIVGLGKKQINSKVIKIESNNTVMDTAKAGDNVYITLDLNEKKDYITKGQSVILTGSTKPIFTIEAKIVSSDLELKEIQEKGNNFYINSDIKCSVIILSEEEKLIKIKLEEPIVVAEKLEILIKQDNKIIAKCIIAE